MRYLSSDKKLARLLDYVYRRNSKNRGKKLAFLTFWVYYIFNTIKISVKN